MRRLRLEPGATKRRRGGGSFNKLGDSEGRDGAGRLISRASSVKLLQSLLARQLVNNLPQSPPPPSRISSADSPCDDDLVAFHTLSAHSLAYARLERMGSAFPLASLHPSRLSIPRPPLLAVPTHPREQTMDSCLTFAYHSWQTFAIKILIKRGLQPVHPAATRWQSGYAASSTSHLVEYARTRSPGSAMSQPQSQR